jgi:catechol 2,3-dioxygenase-like lactoylglutathione lyase family enzyme
MVRAGNGVGDAMKRAVRCFCLSFLGLAGLGAAALAAGPERPAITGVSHIAVYAADAARAEHFYVHNLGAVKRPDPESPTGVRYYVSGTQFVEVLPLPTDAGLNRLDHVAFSTADADGLRRHLAAHEIAVPASVTRNGDGSQSFAVRDPEGHAIEFVQPPASAPAIPDGGLSTRIIHVGFVIRDRAREDAFFREVLGFRPYWYGGMQDEGPPAWVSQQVPDGSDWLEYMITDKTLTQAQMGVLNHFSLGVTNMETAYTRLWNENRLDGQADARGQQFVPKIGRDAKWQLNLLDPEGTRAEVMELRAIGKPCCSAFTAPDPVP